MYKKQSLLLIVLFSIKLLVAEDNTSSCHGFPENNLRYSHKAKNLKMTRFEFDKNLKIFEEIMAPKVLHYYNKELKLEGVWEDDRVNATASRDVAENPVITVSGGLARHPRMDRDALYLILCHELGHQFGGAPKQLRGNTLLRSWSSAEGQADYYATAKCMPYLYERLRQREGDQQKISDSSEVDLVCKTDLCRQVATSAHKLALVFHDVKPTGRAPELLRRDSTVVTQTEYKHPNPQCRLDTFLSGTHCKLDEGVLFDDRDAGVIPCTDLYKSPSDGARPTCWFDPKAY